VPEDESLSIMPKRVACSVCGKTAESTEGWLFQHTRDGDRGMCPSCAPLVQRAAEEQARDANLPNALLYGGAAGLVGSAVWYVLAVAVDVKSAAVAIGIGWLVGKAVVIGGGNKRGTSLQWISGALAVAAVLGGEYFIVNHLVREYSSFSGWLTVEQFFQVYRRLLTSTGGLWEAAFVLFAIATAIALPRPIKLVSKARAH
jgi:hypothetical protein